MEESTTEWKGYKIIRQGKFLRVLKNTRWIDNTFLTIKQAKDWIDLEVETEALKEHNRAIKRLRKEPDIRKRMRMYKELCKKESQQSNHSSED